MDIESYIRHQTDLGHNDIKWSETLQTKSKDRVALIKANSKMDSDMADFGYPYIFLIDFGSELTVESYNAEGEWDVGVDHPLNLELI
mgnify:CR=1 FL=1|tara:strand:- start:603 stop:863 length:261 start_codon:yes stop_codon:yes gene_type:complete